MIKNPFGIALLVLLLCACGKGEHGNGEGGEDDEAPPVPVEVGMATRGDVFATYKGTAPVEAFADAEVIAKVAGEVREIRVEEGDLVKQGQILARLDGDRLRLELEESAARLRKLERDFERNVDLSEKGLISAGDFDNLRYELDALRAAHNLRSLELDYTQIRAPIDGIVSMRYVKIGNTLSVNDPVFRVTSFDPLVSYLHVPEREFRNIEAGQPVRLDIDALDGDPVMATVTRVSPVVDAITGTFKVTIEIRDSERRIKPGMFARIGIVHDIHENALLVPRSALVEEAGEESIFVVNGDKAVRKAVTTGFSGDGRVEILAGLSGDEQIITIGQVGLKNDAEIEIINADPSAPDEAEAVDTAVATTGDATETKD